MSYTGAHSIVTEYVRYRASSRGAAPGLVVMMLENITVCLTHDRRATCTGPHVRSFTLVSLELKSSPQRDSVSPGTGCEFLEGRACPLCYVTLPSVCGTELVMIYVLRDERDRHVLYPVVLKTHQVDLSLLE